MKTKLESELNIKARKLLAKSARKPERLALAGMICGAIGAGSLGAQALLGTLVTPLPLALTLIGITAFCTVINEISWFRHRKRRKYIENPERLKNDIRKAKQKGKHRKVEKLLKIKKQIQKRVGEIAEEISMKEKQSTIEALPKEPDELRSESINIENMSDISKPSVREGMQQPKSVALTKKEIKRETKSILKDISKK